MVSFSLIVSDQSHSSASSNIRFTRGNVSGFGIGKSEQSEGSSNSRSWS